MKANDLSKSDYDTNKILNEIFSNYDATETYDESYSINGTKNQTKSINSTQIKLRVSKNETGLDESK